MVYTELESDVKKITTNLEVSLDSLSSAFTQMREYQDEIEKSKILWEETFNAVESPIAILTSDGYVIKGNTSFQNITNLTDENRLICNVFCGLKRSYFSPDAGCCEEYIYKDSKLYKLKFNPFIDKNKNIKKYVFVAYDITEEFRMQEHLSETISKYLSIFKSAYDPIIVLETESKKIIEVNSAAVKVYGYKSNEFIGLNILNISAEPEESKKIIDNKMEKVPIRFHRKKDGTIFPVEVSASYYENRGFTYCVAIIRDLSDKMSSEAINQCIQKLML